MRTREQITGDYDFLRRKYTDHNGEIHPEDIIAISSRFSLEVLLDIRDLLAKNQEV